MDSKVRIDHLMVEKGLAESREKARAMIMAGLVLVNDTRIDKPGRFIPASSRITLKGRHLPYVSRGGLKLQAALDQFLIDVRGKVLLDVGASTGGFTDCLLQRGARRIVALDVGYGQLHWSLRQDPRVRVIERTNIRYVQPEDLAEEIHGAVIDVSFISLRLVIPPVSKLLLEEAFVVALINPQFEVGKAQVGKGGVVRDPSLQREVIAGLGAFCADSGWAVAGHTSSPILGPKGNAEFLMLLTR